MTTWHVSAALLAQYASDPETVDDVAASSLELHVLRCAHCRAALAAESDVHELELSWDAIADRIDAPRATPVERVLHLLGFSDSWARLVGATRALQLAWLAALLVVVVGTVLLAQRVDDAGPFLVLAPVVPLAAVALTFAPGADPSGEAGDASPLSGFGLVLRRAAAVLGASLALLVAGSFALPDVELVDAAWILPALGLSLGALAAATWVRVELAAVLSAAAWLCSLGVFALVEARPVEVGQLAPLTWAGQLSCAALAIGGALVLYGRRHSFVTLGKVVRP